MTDMYRLRLARQNGGDWQYFESEEKFKEELMYAALCELGNQTRTPREIWLNATRWVQYILKRGERHTIERIVGADKLVNGEWVSLKYEVTPPRLEIHEQAT